MRLGDIKVVADAQKVSTYDDVMAFMVNIMDEVGRQRVAAKMAPYFHNFSIAATEMEVGDTKGPDLWHLHPMMCWQGELKQGQTLQDLHQIQQDACDDLAAAFQAALEAAGFTVLRMYVKNWTGDV